MSTAEKIPFDVDIGRVIEVLARQIYQSPVALLRENAQNAYDAILLRRHDHNEFQPSIQIRIERTEIRVTDNGLGMSEEDLRNHFWRAGASSKNTPEARAAGVVGTFGIGAMANFGISEELTVITESLRTGGRTRSRARRDTLSAREACIELIPEPPNGQAGTEIIAKILPEHLIDVPQAVQYITEFVRFLDVPVYVNGHLVSQVDIRTAVLPPAPAWRFDARDQKIGPRLSGTVEVVGASSGEMWIALTNVKWDGGGLPGHMILRQGVAAIRTFRSGFGLATASVASVYQFGGVADFLFLEPTAGREALETASLQILQSMLSEIDSFCSEQIASRPQADSSTAFMTWITQQGRYELCGQLRIRLEPLQPITLSEVSERTKGSQPAMLLYTAADPSVISHYTSEDRPLLVLAGNHPRRQCEVEFLRRHSRTEEVSDNPRVVDGKQPNEWSFAESALSFRMATILETDYFLGAQVGFGKITHRLPLLVTPSAEPVLITLDPGGATVQLILSLYERDFLAFGSLTKDFIRNVIFPRVADLVPSSTRQGAEAFLKSIRRPREIFEYESSDLGDLPSIWQDVIEGKISVARATELSIAAARASVQVVDSSAAAQISEVVPDVVANEATLRQGNVPSEEDLGPAPAVLRQDKGSPAKLLLIGDGEQPLRGFRCFLAVTDLVRREHGSFFLQPHRTSVVWGGQKALFIFQHHSGRFGLYYDLQSREVIAAESGGGAFPTYTIVLKDKIFIPIPEPIRSSFIPKAGERKRFEIKCDYLQTGGQDG